MTTVNVDIIELPNRIPHYLDEVRVPGGEIGVVWWVDDIDCCVKIDGCFTYHLVSHVTVVVRSVGVDPR